MNKSFEMNFAENTITCSASFLKKASVLNSKEYKELLQLRRDWPEFKIVKAEGKSNSGSGISFKQMEGFIRQCKDAETRLAIFNKVMSLSKTQSSPYFYVKKWFLENYANYSETPEFGEDRFAIVKTKAEKDAEAKAKEEAEKATAAEQKTDNQNNVTSINNKAA